MTSELCLPRSTLELLNRTEPESRHTGLQLDKLTQPGDQIQQREALKAVCKTRGEGVLLEHLLRRRRVYLEALSADPWSCKTAGPLTLHLARASALENAGICLHPLYGFVYLPGSGLKGMARAYAETVWLPAQFEADAGGKPKDEGKRQKAADAWNTIEQVFGWAPGSDKGKRWKPDGASDHAKDDQARVGGIVFHDAWPQRWPKLIVDLVNNHHADYYDGKQDDAHNPPGDWESPNMVSFLAINPGEVFCFALSKRAPDVDESLVDLARQWLTGALCHLGAGAKTAAGYGSFQPVKEEPPRLQSPARAAFETTLELVTPAFLAGAAQQAEDCDLRPATLRGLLRWWWRTMHAGIVDTPDLRRLEAAVWGDTNAGAAVRLTVQPDPQAQPGKYDYKDRFRPKPDFKRQHDLQDTAGKTTQGLFYNSYGMDDGENKRWFMPPGARWKVSMTARSAHYPTDAPPEKARHIDADLLLCQAQAALWLLCRYGGVGSKARKGFGSFADIECGIKTLDDCKAAARAFRSACDVTERKERDAESSALGSMLPVLEIPTPWKDCWFALDQLGFAGQAFAQRYAHREEKEALGLPRKIHGPRNDGPMRNQNRQDWQAPVWLGELHEKRDERKIKDMRHASPVHYHLAGNPEGNLIIRVAAFPARYLPDTDTSRAFLGDLLSHLKTDFERRVEEHKDKGQRPVRAAAPQVAATPAGAALPKPGDRVEAVLLAETTKKGGWKARHVETGIIGPIQNSGDVPADMKAEDRVTLIVRYARQNEIGFRWPTAGDEARESKKKSPGKRGGKPRRRS